MLNFLLNACPTLMADVNCEPEFLKSNFWLNLIWYFLSSVFDKFNIFETIYENGH